jgi:hypothetical protein
MRKTIYYRKTTHESEYGPYTKWYIARRIGDSGPCGTLTVAGLDLGSEVRQEAARCLWLMREELRKDVAKYLGADKGGIISRRTE